MNKLIYRQLQEVTSADIEFDENTTSIFIPKTSKILNKSMKPGQVFDIELNNSVVNPGPESTLAANWNNGITPKYSKYTIEVISLLSKMVKVNGVAIEDNQSQFFGWLPIDSFKILKRYE